MKTLLTFALFASNLFAAVEYDYMRVSRTLASPDWIRTTGFIEDHIRNDQYVVGYLPKTTILKFGDWSKIVTLDAKVWAQHKFDLDLLEELPSPIISGPYEDFHTYETLTAELQSLSTKYPELISLETAGKTVQSRELWVTRLTNKNHALASKPKLLLISSMHGDEVTGKEMMMYLVRLVLQSYGKDSRITQLLDNNEIFIMPSMNPDGTALHQRFNADGVDLNRDFPKLNESPSAPNHAVEVRNIQALHQKHHFVTALNFHGGTVCFNIPWDSKENTAGALFGDDALIMSLARFYADHNGPMHDHHESNFDHGVTYGYEWYPVYGGMQDWASYFYQSTHATVELSDIKWPAASALPGFWNDNREALLGYLEHSTTGIHLKVTNRAGTLLPVDVQMASASRTLKYQGYVHRPTSKTMETITVSSTGYKPQTLSLAAHAYNGVLQTVVLESQKQQ